MKVYLEYIFIINFLLDYMILYGTKRILKINTKTYKLLISSFIGAMTTFILLINITNIELIIIKILISILMNYISFNKKNLIQNTLYFYIISIIIGGTIYLFNLNSNLYLNTLIIVIITPIIIITIIKEISNIKLNIKNKYNVKLLINNKTYTLEGFIDTGNRLTSPITNKPVIIVNLDIKQTNYMYIPYNALNKEGIIKCIKPDKVEIEDKIINNCLIGLSEDKLNINGLNCILPNKFKEIL